jgi:hypothetical protein
MAASGLLLLSGLINFVRIVQRYDFPEGSLYHMLFGIKFLLALAVFYLASALAGRSHLAQRLQSRERVWLSWTVVLAVAVVLLAGVMKIAARTEKSTQSLRRSPPSPALAFAQEANARLVLNQPARASVHWLKRPRACPGIFTFLAKKGVPQEYVLNQPARASVRFSRESRGLAPNG